jgi:exopolyphosphatase / guanosine-5'-triphosphate,3'-diphosphate pyrophosphatase
MSRNGMERPMVSRGSFLREWVLSHLGSVRHERRVATLASTLAQVTAPLHDLTPADVRLLKLAAMVHDVGRYLSDKHHPAVGASMVWRDETLPLSRRQRRTLAYLTLRHRGAVPEISDDKVLRPRDDAKSLRVLLGLLRAADCLDSRSMPSPRITMARRGRKVHIYCQLREDTAKARRIFSRRKKFRLLEEMLDCRVEVHISAANTRMRAVA